MSRSSFVDFKAIKAALTMEQVLNHYGLFETFKKSGEDGLTGPCPLHKGTNPSQFRVSLSKNIWNCFSECKHGGNVLDFIARMENIKIHAAALKAIVLFKLKTDAPALQSEVESKTSAAAETKSAPKAAAVSTETVGPNPPLKFRLDKLQMDHPYPIERGLTKDTVEHFGIGFCNKGMLKDHIAIPIHNAAGDVVAYAGRWPGEPPEYKPKYKLPPGFKKSQEVFNLSRAIQEPDDNPLVIVEGFFACMNLWQHGLKKVVALMGSSLSEAQEQLIRGHTDSNSRILIMFDEDEAGRSGREDVAVRFSKFCFVKAHTFETEGFQADRLTGEEIATIAGDFGI